MEKLRKPENVLQEQVHQMGGSQDSGGMQEQCSHGGEI